MHRYLLLKKGNVPKPSGSSNPAITKSMWWLLLRHWSPEQIAWACLRKGFKMPFVENNYLFIYAKKKKIIYYAKNLQRHNRKRRKRRLIEQLRTIIRNNLHLSPTQNRIWTSKARKFWNRPKEMPNRIPDFYYSTKNIV